MELIVGIVHLIYPEHCLEAAFVETGVVRHERQTFDQRRNLFPYIREHGCIVRVLGTQPVHALAEPLVVLRLGVDEAVERVRHLPVAHNHHSHRTHAGRLLVCRLEIYCRKISHML